YFSIDSTGGGPGCALTVGTTNPDAAGGSISVGPGGNQGQLTFFTGVDPQISVIAGGNLTVDGGSFSSLGAGSHLLLSAGVVPDSYSFPVIDGTVSGAPPILTNVNSVNPTLLGTQHGNLVVNEVLGAIGNQATTLTLVSNSDAPLE